ncbi:MAG: hypothetical protein HGA31_00230 [Candidatus Moranbacteria bacterium]|nr:hypothetical protein [Candidatus Moranbacteria bacterium]
MASHKKSVFPAWEAVFDMSASELTTGYILSLTGYPKSKGAVDRLVVFLDRRKPELGVKERFARQLVEFVKPFAESWVPLTDEVLAAIMLSDGAAGDSISDSNPEDAWDRLFRHLREAFPHAAVKLRGLFAVSAMFSLARGEYIDAITGATNVLFEVRGPELANHGHIKRLESSVEWEKASVLAEVLRTVLGKDIGLPVVGVSRKSGNRRNPSKRRHLGSRLSTHEDMEGYHWHYLLVLLDEHITPDRIIDEFRMVNPMSGIRDIGEMASYFDRHIRGFRRRFVTRLINRHIGPIWESVVRNKELILSRELSMIVFVPEEYEKEVHDDWPEKDGTSDFLLEELKGVFRRTNPGLMMDSLSGKLVRARFELNRGRYGASLKTATAVLWKHLEKTDTGGAYIRTERIKAETLTEEMRESLFILRNLKTKGDS